MNEHIRRNEIWGKEGFYSRFLVGSGIDIGAGDFPLNHPSVLHYDRSIDPSHDAVSLPGIKGSSFDWVYSSHCLEHLPDPMAALVRWWDILKTGGHLVLLLPDWTLYEHRQWPSWFNSTHRYAFSLSRVEGNGGVKILDPITMIRELDGAWLQYARINDSGFDYNAPKQKDQTLNGVLSEMEIVVRKGCPYL
jgi:SAM-dependent methyltransferase